MMHFLAFFEFLDTWTGFIIWYGGLAIAIAGLIGFLIYQKKKQDED